MIHVTSVLKYNPKAGEEAQMMIVRAMDRISGFARRVAVQGAPRHTGQLINSIHHVREYNPPEYIGGIRTNLAHAVVMEEGRRPGTWPPPLPIFRWVWLKRASFGVQRAAGTSGVVRLSREARSRVRARRGNEELKRVRRIAFLVARKIKEKGIEGRKFFHKAEQAVRVQFEREINILGLDIKRAWDLGG